MKMKNLLLAVLSMLAITTSSTQAEMVSLPLTKTESQAVALTVYVMNCATTENLASKRIVYAQWTLSRQLDLVRYGTLDKFVPQFDRIVTEEMGVAQFCTGMNQVLDSNIDQLKGVFR